MFPQSQFHSKKDGFYLPVKFLGIFLFLFSFLPSFLFSESISSIPNFELEDQFGKKVSYGDLKDKKTIYAGCYPEDEEICRKIARKIYWKMQSLIYGKEKNYFFLGYIILNKSNPILAESLIPKYKSSGYESVYLDWKGKLAEGSKIGKVHIRAVNEKGHIVLEEHWIKAENDDVVYLYRKLNK
jgi:hypothetical protein